MRFNSAGNGCKVRTLKTFPRCAAAILLMAATPALAQKADGTLRILHRENPPSASIHEEATISTVMPFMSVFNNLVVFDPTTRQNSLDAIVPDLATEWRWSEDGTRLTFRLRDGVRWHDGKPFGARDVACTFDMLTGKAGSELRKNPRKTWYLNLREVAVNGDREVTFVLGRPQPSFLGFLASAFAPIYPCHVPVAQMRTRPIGTGPFRFVELRRNETITLRRNSDYWKAGRPYLDGLEFTIVPNRSTMILAFVTGAHDMTFTADVPPALLDDVRAQAPRAICELLPTGTQTNLLVNREKPPFDDARIRRAMGLAIDRSVFADILSKGADTIGAAMLPPPDGLWGSPPDLIAALPGYGPDVARRREEARGIMRELGYGPDKPLRIKVTTRNLPSYRDPAVILTDQLKQIHIDGELEVIDSSVWYNRLARKDFLVGLNVQGVPVDDPDVVLYEGYSCNSERNYTNYCNPELEQMFHLQSATLDRGERRKLVWEIDRRLQEDGARPVISHNKAATCWYPQVRGLNLPVNTIYNHWRFEDIWLER
jgi:peptide/nickel transport system substrate-binding protein